MYYATLRDNQLITPGHNGKQLITEVDGPGAYEVRTCRERGDVIEFGSGRVYVSNRDLEIAEIFNGRHLQIFDHQPVILVDYPNVTFVT